MPGDDQGREKNVTERELGDVVKGMDEKQASTDRKSEPEAAHGAELP